MTTETQAVTPVQDATPAQEPSTPSPEVNQDAPPPEKSEVDRLKESYEKRIARQTAANREQQRQFENERRLRETAEKRIAEYEGKVSLAPKADDFNTPEEYAEALADFKLKERELADKAPKPPSVEEIRKQEREFALKQMTFTQKENDFRAKNPNYDQAASVVNKLMSMASPQDPSFAAFAQTIMDAENAPELIHYLGTNPQEALNLFGKSPAEVEDSLLVIIDKLGAPVAPVNSDEEPFETPNVLPAPPKPITNGSAKIKKNPDQMSGKELLKHMESLRRRGT